MTKTRLIIEHSRYVLLSCIIYFCFDYLVYRTNFLQVYSFVGLKSFLPIILGLNYGLYGVIGELIAIFIKYYLTGIGLIFINMECMIVIIIGIGSWFLWHISSITHRIHFRFVFHYVRYTLIVLSLSFICALIGYKLINNIAFEEIMIWVVFMSILVGIPIEIIYAGLMNMNPVLPPLYRNGKRISLYYDIEYTLYNEPRSLQDFNARLEAVAEREKVSMKKLFEVQNIVEEIYLRIMKNNPKTIIDISLGCDIKFSIEFLYIGKRFNPFYVKKGEEDVDVIGLTIIKHRALLSFYNYNYGLNKIHIVI